jgi:hypothetical protein
LWQHSAQCMHMPLAGLGSSHQTQAACPV